VVEFEFGLDGVRHAPGRGDYVVVADGRVFLVEVHDGVPCLLFVGTPSRPSPVRHVGGSSCRVFVCSALAADEAVTRGGLPVCLVAGELALADAAFTVDMTCFVTGNERLDARLREAVDVARRFVVLR